MNENGSDGGGVATASADAGGTEAQPTHVEIRVALMHTGRETGYVVKTIPLDPTQPITLPQLVDEIVNFAKFELALDRAEAGIEGPTEGPIQ